jgi:hypothetical protein
MNKWTEDEKNFILEKYKSGKSIEEIHKTGKINRSKYAIECKLYGHIYDLLQNGKSHSSVSKEFDRTVDEIKEIEIKAFEMRNKSDTKTMYTGDGGYKYGETKAKIGGGNDELSSFHNINRTMNTILSYYENIDRLNRLKQSKTIDDDFYKQLMTQLNNFTFDKQKIINSLNSNTNEIEIKTEDSDEKPKKKSKELKDEDDGLYIKKIKKRLI